MAVRTNPRRHTRSRCGRSRALAARSLILSKDRMRISAVVQTLTGWRRDVGRIIHLPPFAPILDLAARMEVPSPKLEPADSREPFEDKLTRKIDCLFLRHLLQIFVGYILQIS